MHFLTSSYSGKIKVMIGLHKHYFSSKSPSFSQRVSSFVDRDFQLKYTIIFSVMAGLGLLAILGPAIYLLNQNYEIFLKLAYDTSPQIVEYLERELWGLNIYISAAFCVIAVFFTMLAFRFTHKIIAPLMVIKKHLMKLSRGHWSHPTIKIREDDEFQELVEVYNYFYSAFQTQIKHDLHRIHKIRVDENDIESKQLKSQLISEKSEQLGLSVFESDFCPVVNLAKVASTTTKAIPIQKSPKAS